MRYGSTLKATDLRAEGWAVKALRALLWFVPRAAPDQEPLYPQVRKWLIEVDESGNVAREIALGENDTPLFAAPNAKNRGFWSDHVISKDELAPIEAGHFEQLWSRCISGQRMAR
jgi:hypothetical protein